MIDSQFNNYFKPSSIKLNNTNINIYYKYIMY